VGGPVERAGPAASGCPRVLGRLGGLVLSGPGARLSDAQRSGCSAARRLGVHGSAGCSARRAPVVPHPCVVLAPRRRSRTCWRGCGAVPGVRCPGGGVPSHPGVVVAPSRRSRTWWTGCGAVLGVRCRAVGWCRTPASLSHLCVVPAPVAEGAGRFQGCGVGRVPWCRTPARIPHPSERVRGRTRGAGPARPRPDTPSVGRRCRWAGPMRRGPPGTPAVAGTVGPRG